MWASRWCVTDEGYVLPVVAAHGPIGQSYYLVEQCPYGCGAWHHHGDEEGHFGSHCDRSRAHPWSPLGYWLLPHQPWA
jgi:hypothetical protein